MRDRLEQLAGHVRRRLPLWLLPIVVGLRFRLAWSRSAVRDNARAQMRFLLERSRPDADVEAAARGYLREQLWRGERRWHPELVTRQRVEGIEHLRSVADGRGAVVSFMHHGSFDGLCASLNRHGFRFWMLAYPTTLRDDAPAWLRQHVRVSTAAGDVAVGTDIGTDGIARLLEEGKLVSLALDVPGHTRTRFADRDVLGASGAARLSVRTSCPVVPVTAERDSRGAHLRVHPPVLPADFASPEDMLEHLLRLHERAVLAWPEAVDVPLSRWGLRPSEMPQGAETPGRDAGA